MFKIIFVNSPSRSACDRPPLQYFYLSSYIKSKLKDKIRVKLIDPIGIPHRETAFSITIKQTKEIGPDLVCLSSYSNEVLENIYLAESLKKVMPDVPVVIGGIHSTLVPEYFLSSSKGIDYSVVGPGERTLFELAKRLIDKDHNYNGIPGLVWRDGDKIVKNPTMNQIDDDVLNVPFLLDELEVERYVKVSLWNVRGIPIRGMWLLSSRGCPYECGFCSNKALTGRKIWFRDPRVVVDDICLLKEKYAIDGFYLCDDPWRVYCERVDFACLECVW